MILDSGAGVTTIDRDFARQIGLKKGISISAQGVGGVQQAELVQDVTVEVGNLKLSGVSVAVIDLDAIEKAIGRPMPVILGRELFMSSVVGLDFDKQLLTLSPAIELRGTRRRDRGQAQAPGHAPLPSDFRRRAKAGRGRPGSRQRRRAEPVEGVS